MWGVIGALAGLAAGAAYNKWTADEAMEDQAWYNRDAQIWSARELPSIQIEGMKKAQVNPMLAYGNLGSVNSPSVNAVAPDAVDFSGVGSAIGQALDRRLKMENTAAEVDLKNAQAGYYDVLAEKESRLTPSFDLQHPVNSAKNAVNALEQEISSAKNAGVQEAAKEAGTDPNYPLPPPNQNERSKPGQPLTKKDMEVARAAQRRELKRREEERRRREDRRRREKENPAEYWKHSRGKYGM